MSRFAAHQPEAFAGLLFEQPLDFELGFGGAGKRDPQVECNLALRRAPVELRLDQHECRAAQNSIDQKEIVEPVCMNGRNLPPLLNSHSNVLPARFVALTASKRGNTSLTFVTSEQSFPPLSYGCDTLFRSMEPNRQVIQFTTGGRA